VSFWLNISKEQMQSAFGQTAARLIGRDMPAQEINFCLDSFTVGKDDFPLLS